MLLFFCPKVDHFTYEIVQKVQYDYNDEDKKKNDDRNNFRNVTDNKNVYIFGLV